MAQRNVPVSSRLGDVRYEIRGALSRRARELEAEGREIIRLNIGNPGLFGFSVPVHVRAAVESRLAQSEAYCHQQGLMAAREAIAARETARGAFGAHAENVFIGNGVSELIDLTLRALLNSSEEVLLPSPDYPLWSAATVLNGGRARYYPCPASRGHLPDPDEVESLITPRTRALVLINPNNPTGAVYPTDLLKALVRVAERHRLLLLSDEIYDGILYDQAAFQPLAPLAGDLPCVTYSGLSKMHRACGYRVGWISLSGADSKLAEFRSALDLLSALRLCANVPTQWGVAPAINGPDTTAALTSPGGRLYEARRAVIEGVRNSEFLSVVEPQGALYAFPSVRNEHFSQFDDETFALDLLETENVLVVPGTGFNIRERNHFRLTLLPEPDQIADVFDRIERCLDRLAAGSKARARHVA
ncbi:aminotransferase class I/II-fold pyridoxal phosphate-dependent enzyme [Tahibacter amnicola]|uniref:alanine transaminase n=1 Tax=Tahibacter amnicola TaxID=2976241 RepID=A0ABY6BHS2_9GAMM|nr:aminotransferase class I/II-fold pyridoxal phosphate-dependent enzyme [Tahibacter amnicola]UXI69151.1 aminotransferase class I/II-fold pyridoxal phosphate-dependent enzyme [Tahibacter amnicola]